MYHSIVLPEYAQIDKTKKRPENKVTGDVMTRPDSDLIVHENSLYRAGPINKERKESGSDSDEIFEENEVYASSVSDAACVASSKDPATPNQKENGENEMGKTNEHGYYNLPPKWKQRRLKDMPFKYKIGDAFSRDQWMSRIYLPVNESPYGHFYADVSRLTVLSW